MPWVLSSFYCLELEYFPTLCDLQMFSQQFLGICSFSGLKESHPRHAQLSFSQRLKKPLWRFLEFFLDVATTSALLYPTNSRHLSLAKLWFLSPQFKESMKLLCYTWFPHPKPGLVNASRKKARETVELILFVFLLSGTGILAVFCLTSRKKLFQISPPVFYYLWLEG